MVGVAFGLNSNRVHSVCVMSGERTRTRTLSAFTSKMYTKVSRNSRLACSWSERMNTRREREPIVLGERVLCYLSHTSPTSGKKIKKEFAIEGNRTISALLSLFYFFSSRPVLCLSSTVPLISVYYPSIHGVSFQYYAQALCGAWRERKNRGERR